MFVFKLHEVWIDPIFKSKTHSSITLLQVDRILLPAGETLLFPWAGTLCHGGWQNTMKEAKCRLQPKAETPKPPESWMGIYIIRRKLQNVCLGDSPIPNSGSMSPCLFRNASQLAATYATGHFGMRRWQLSVFQSISPVCKICLRSLFPLRRKEPRLQEVVCGLWAPRAFSIWKPFSTKSLTT